MISATIKQLKDKLGNAIAPITHEKAIVMTEGGTLGDKLTAIDSGISSVEQKAIATLTHSKSGTVHALTGLSGKTGIVSVKFKATAAFAAGDSFKVDGVTYTAKQTNGKALAANQFVSGAVVDCLLDTGAKTVNFKGGGVDVSAATATESDVLAGETFFAGLDSLRTGTLEKGYKEIHGSHTLTSYSPTPINTIINCEFTPHVFIWWKDTSSTRPNLDGGFITLENFGKEYAYVDYNDTQVRPSGNSVKIYQPQQSPYSGKMYYSILGK